MPERKDPPKPKEKPDEVTATTVIEKVNQLKYYRKHFPRMPNTHHGLTFDDPNSPLGEANRKLQAWVIYRQKHQGSDEVKLQGPQISKLCSLATAVEKNLRAQFKKLMNGSSSFSESAFKEPIKELERYVESLKENKNSPEAQRELVEMTEFLKRMSPAYEEELKRCARALDSKLSICRSNLGVHRGHAIEWLPLGHEKFNQSLKDCLTIGTEYYSEEMEPGYQRPNWTQNQLGKEASDLVVLWEKDKEDSNKSNFTCYKTGCLTIRDYEALLDLVVKSGATIAIFDFPQDTNWHLVDFELLKKLIAKAHDRGLSVNFGSHLNKHLISINRDKEFLDLTLQGPANPIKPPKAVAEPDSTARANDLAYRIQQLEKMQETIKNVKDVKTISPDELAKYVKALEVTTKEIEIDLAMLTEWVKNNPAEKEPVDAEYKQIEKLRGSAEALRGELSKIKRGVVLTPEQTKALSNPVLDTEIRGLNQYGDWQRLVDMRNRNLP